MLAEFPREKKTLQKPKQVQNHYMEEVNINREADSLMPMVLNDLQDQIQNEAHSQQAQRAISKAETEKRRAKEFCELVFPYVTEVDGTWENISDKDHLLVASTSSFTPTSVQLPFAEFRDTKRNIHTLWKYLWDDNIWNFIYTLTRAKVNKASRDEDRKTSKKPFNLEHVKRTVLALIDHGVNHINQRPADFFKAADQPAGRRPEVAKERRWGVSSDLFWSNCQSSRSMSEC